MDTFITTMKMPIPTEILISMEILIIIGILVYNGNLRSHGTE